MIINAKYTSLLGNTVQALIKYMFRFIGPLTWDEDFEKKIREEIIYNVWVKKKHFKNFAGEKVDLKGVGGGGAVVQMHNIYLCIHTIEK